jgi:hypothetical protein
MTKLNLLLITYLGVLLPFSAAMAVDSTERLANRKWNHELIYLDQGWGEERIQQYYHTTEGTFLMPYSWAKALISLAGKGSLFELVEEQGVLKDDPSAENPEGLPVGFALDNREFLPNRPWLGVSCAMCHAGELRFGDHRIRIPGGTSPVDYLGVLDQLLGRLGQVTSNQTSFDAFAKKVLGENAAADAITKLRTDVESLLEPERRFEAERVRLLPVQFGPYRLDALQLGFINNQLSRDPRNQNTLPPANAPVRFPSVWNGPWRDNVQYSVQIHSPLARNVIQAVSSSLVRPRAESPASAAHFQNLIAIEEWLRELQPPQWPEDILGPVDFSKAARGRDLFREQCQQCHNWNHTEPNEAGFSFLKTIEIPNDVSQMQTDPTQIEAVRAKNPGAPDRMEVLTKLSNQLIEGFFREAKLSEDERVQATHGKLNVWRVREGYAASALDGIWATPPYLHNGSVPTLYDLLSPVSKRPTKFQLGSGKYDPQKVGFASDGRFEFDTSLPGNSNSGHTWGTNLEEPDRLALVEFLKKVREWGIPRSLTKPPKWESRLSEPGPFSPHTLCSILPNGIVGKLLHILGIFAGSVALITAAHNPAIGRHN